MALMKKIILLLTLLICLASCAAEPKFPDYAELSFGGYLELLGEPREDVEKALSMTDETWDYLELDGLPGPRPNLKEPVEVDGAAYTLYLRFTEGPEADSPSSLNRYYYVHTESGDPETKKAAVQALYDLLVTELGEPEEPGVHMVYSQKVSDSGELEGPVTETPTDDPYYTTVREGFEQGFSSTQPYEEKWVLAENVRDSGNEDGNVVLLAYMEVRWLPGGAELEVGCLLREASLTRIARYPQKPLSEQ